MLKLLLHHPLLHGPLTCLVKYAANAFLSTAPRNPGGRLGERRGTRSSAVMTPLPHRLLYNVTDPRNRIRARVLALCNVLATAFGAVGLWPNCCTGGGPLGDNRLETVRYQWY